MQWVAYIIWSAVILCVLCAVVSYVASRRRANLPQAAAPGCSGGQMNVALTPSVDESRWLQLVSRCGLDPQMLTDEPGQRLALGVDVLGADSSWLQGKDAAMYPCLTFHNNVAAAADFIEQRLDSDQPLSLYAVKPAAVPLDESVYEASVVLCFVQQVQVGQQKGGRYFPVNVYWEWGYPPEQMQCRQILYLARCAGCQMVGVETDMDGIYELLEGIAVPDCIDPTVNSVAVWSPADYALPGQDVMGLTECHLRREQLLALVKEKGWPCIETETA
jgi:hypothetical protein